MIVRLITPTKQVRLTVDPVSTLEDAIKQKLNCTSFQATLDQNTKSFLDITKTFSYLKIVHGASIFIHNLEMPVTEKVKEDDLKSDSGLIKRSMSVYCNHTKNAMCSNCAPLDPWDPSYHSENKIKYLSFKSFQAMLKKNNTCVEEANYSISKKELDSENKQNKDSCLFPIYEKNANNTKIKNDQEYNYQNEKYFNDEKNKFNHLFPVTERNNSEGKPNSGQYLFQCQERHGLKACCALCMPQIISLTPQVYRMIDHIEFECSEIVESLVGFWRCTGKQRFGYLIGKESDYKHVPLGKKVIVSAIYEPVQENFPDGFILNNSHKNKKNISEKGSVDEINIKSYEALYYIIKELGLEIVGMIYTNISKDEHSISSLETDFMAKQQLENLHFCIESGNYFNSKFVTVIVHNESIEEHSDEENDVKNPKNDSKGDNNKNLQKNIGKSMDIDGESTKDEDIKVIRTINNSNTDKNIKVIKSINNKNDTIIKEKSKNNNITKNERDGTSKNYIEDDKNKNTLNSEKNESIKNEKKYQVKKTQIVTTELMVSHQLMTLKHTNSIFPTEDPEIMMVNKNTNTEIHYRAKNKYGLVETIKADPYLPIEYFWVRLTHGFKKFKNDEKSNKVLFGIHTTGSNNSKSFTWKDTNKKMSAYFNGEYKLEKFANLDVLVKIKMEKMIEDDNENMIGILLKAIKEKNNEIFENQFINSTGFMKFKKILGEFEIIEWNCAMCTFLNPGDVSFCEICEMPKVND